MGYSLLIFLGFLFCSSINGHSVQDPACPSFDCGNGIAISYPFWYQNQQLEHCGYPSFDLSCSDQNPMLHFSDSDLYPIIDINYSNKSLTLAYSVLKSATCPKLTHNITLNTTPPPFTTSGNKLVHFFYNCTLYPPSLPHIECLKYDAKRSYVFKEEAIPEFDWQRYCASTVVVPVIEEAMDHGDLVQGFGHALQKGFKLTWNEGTADIMCQSCEATGGFCSYSNGLRNNFFCICSYGRESTNCRDDAAASQTRGVRRGPNYVGIGALLFVFGGLVILATVFYITQKKKTKKKVGSYRPV